MFPCSMIHPSKGAMGGALHCTALHCTALHSTALHCTALHCTEERRINFFGPPPKWEKPQSNSTIIVPPKAARGAQVSEQQPNPHQSGGSSSPGQGWTKWWSQWSPITESFNFWWKVLLEFYAFLFTFWRNESICDRNKHIATNHLTIISMILMMIRISIPKTK